MKKFYRKAALAIGLSVLGLCSPVSRAQSQSAEAQTRTVVDLAQRLDQIQKEVDRLKAELGSIRRQTGNSSPDKRRRLSEQLEDLQRQLDRLKADLASAKQQLNVTSPKPSVPVPSSIGAAAPIGTDEPNPARARTGAPAQNAAAVGEAAESFAGRLIQYQRTKNLGIRLTNGQGAFTTGTNSFCLEFRNARTDKIVDVGKVQVDFTLEIRRVKTMRAVVQLAQPEVGRYCGRVTLHAAGPWSVTVKYQGASGNGRVVFPVAAN